MIRLSKSNAASALASPLESMTARSDASRARRYRVCDGAGRVYAEGALRGGAATFSVRGTAGTHRVALLDETGDAIDEATFVLKPRTGFRCDAGPYADLANRIQQLITVDALETAPFVINGRVYRMLVCWGRDHVYTLKAAKYFIDDVTSGLDYWLDTQEPNGMVWDCIYRNEEAPAPTWFGEALGKGWFRYDDGMKFIVRRIPVEADCEYLYTEGVWHAWKASGDDGWMARQLPRLEKALTYNMSSPEHWSRKHQLVRRSMCMDSWDFVNPLFCSGDHRCYYPQDEQFLFHGDNSGLYASHWRMAEMHEHLGNRRRAAQLRRQGEALRRRANDKLFFDPIYGHMIPETADPRAIYARVGDERRRLSLSTGYTINRGLPTHAMAVKILREYQRRGKKLRRESFAEWWTMDPPYQPEQWPGQREGMAGCPVGEYMNGAICPISGGELAKAAFDHGMEDYGVDILRRLWALSERDGGDMFQAYRRLPGKVAPSPAKFRFVDLRAVVNRGLRHRAAPGVVAWTNEKDNDLRHLPVGRQRFGIIDFDIIDPVRNGGRAALRIDPDPARGPTQVTIPVANLTGRSLYFLHATAHSAPEGGVVGVYQIAYADGQTERLFIRQRREIGHWWGVLPPGRAAPNLRVAWQGANPTWKNVGIYMYGWNNPRPDVPIASIRVEAVSAGGRGGGILLAGISVADKPVEFDVSIRSYGLPSCWAQASVYHGVAQGLAGIEDGGRAFSVARVCPRWAATEASEAEATLAYPASDGYCSYRCAIDRRRRRISVDLAGSFERVEFSFLLPRGWKPKRLRVDGADVAFTTRAVERSRYLDAALPRPPRSPVVIEC